MHTLTYPVHCFACDNLLPAGSTSLVGSRCAVWAHFCPDHPITNLSDTIAAILTFRTDPRVGGQADPLSDTDYHLLELAGVRPATCNAPGRAPHPRPPDITPSICDPHGPLK